MGTLLMCKPAYYGIEYEINPWMSRRRPADARHASWQWECLYDVLTERLGVDVELIDPIAGLPDLVFAANAGLVHRDAFIPSRFRHEERAREEPVWTAWFAGRGYRILELPPGPKFEGEGDALLAGGTLFAGTEFRSDRTSHAAIQELLSLPVVSLDLVNPYFYHLDTCFAPLDGDRLMYYPDAFSAESRLLIEQRFPHRLEVNEDEARRFVCNAIVLGDSVVTSADCPEAAAGLRKWGYRVLPVETSEFVKAGGSAKCMVLFLDRQAVEGGSGEEMGTLTPALSHVGDSGERG